jgi:hypothetical protein
MTSHPSECVQHPIQNGDTKNASTCSVQFDNFTVPSVQYQCGSAGEAVLSSVMVNATDPISKIVAPFKLTPDKSCGDICDYKLGYSGYKVRDIQIRKTEIQVGDENFQMDNFLCQ